MSVTVRRLIQGMSSACRGKTLFDAEFYSELYPDVQQQGVRPEDHYARVGSAEGRCPNALALVFQRGRRTASRFFISTQRMRWLAARIVVSPDFYRSMYPDILRADVDPVEHYVSFGWTERRIPSRLFAIACEIGVLVSMLFSILRRKVDGKFEPVSRLAPSPVAKQLRRLSAQIVVNPKFYLSMYPDVQRAGVDPVEHYVSHGWRERRIPSRLFAVPSEMRAIASTLVSVRRSKPGRKLEDLRRRALSPFASALLDYALLRRSRLTLLREPRSEADATSRLLVGTSSLDGASQDKSVWTDRRRDELFGLAKNGSVWRLILLVSLWKRELRRRGIGVVGGVFSVVRVDEDKRSWLKLHRFADGVAGIYYDPAIANLPDAGMAHAHSTPAVWLATVQNAQISGAFQVCVKKSFVQYEPAADLRYDFVAGQWPYAIAIARAPGKILTFTPYTQHEVLAQGILISGRCSPNYFHFLIEYLAKAYVCSLLPELDDVPLIVDAGLYPQQRDVLNILFPGRDLVFFAKDSRIDVARLHLPSIPTFLPDTLDEPLWKGAAVRPEPIQFLRNRIFSHFGLSGEADAPGRRIFLARKAGRGILNGEDVEAMLVDQGFELFDPGTLSFEQQVRLFASAGTIIGGLGAAFANVIFCRPGTRVLGLCSPAAVKFPMFASLSELVGCRYMVMGGEQDGYRAGEEDKPNFSLFHGSYSVDLDRLRNALALLEAGS
jgi:capsular polysaccharide biosynthesis protein